MNSVKAKKENEDSGFKPHLKKAYGRYWRLMSQIRKSTKTVNCECGSVKLNILSKPGKIDYKCTECGKYVETIDYDECEAINSECKK